MNKLRSLIHIPRYGVKLAFTLLALVAGGLYVAVPYLPWGWQELPHRITNALKNSPDLPPPEMALPDKAVGAAGPLANFTVTGSSIPDPRLTYAFYLGSVIVGVSIVVLFISLPVYIFSNDPQRSRRAGGVTKTALSFLVSSGAGVMAFLGFVGAK